LLVLANIEVSYKNNFKEIIGKNFLVNELKNKDEAVVASHSSTEE